MILWYYVSHYVYHFFFYQRWYTTVQTTILAFENFPSQYHIYDKENFLNITKTHTLGSKKTKIRGFPRITMSLQAILYRLGFSIADSC